MLALACDKSWNMDRHCKPLKADETSNDQAVLGSAARGGMSDCLIDWVSLQSLQKVIAFGLNPCDSAHSQILSGTRVRKRLEYLDQPRLPH